MEKKEEEREKKNCFQFKMQNASLFLYLMMIRFLHFFYGAILFNINI